MDQEKRARSQSRVASAPVRVLVLLRGEAGYRILLFRSSSWCSFTRTIDRHFQSKGASRTARFSVAQVGQLNESLGSAVGIFNLHHWKTCEAQKYAGWSVL